MNALFHRSISTPKGYVVSGTALMTAKNTPMPKKGHSIP